MKNCTAKICHKKYFFKTFGIELKPGLFSSTHKKMNFYRFISLFKSKHSMVKTYESRFPPSPNLDKVTVSFEILVWTAVSGILFARFPTVECIPKVKAFYVMMSQT